MQKQNGGDQTQSPSVQLNALPDYLRKQAITLLRAEKKESQLRGKFIDALMADDNVKSTDLISPNPKTNKANYLKSTCTQEFYDSLIDTALVGMFSAIEIKCLKMPSKLVVASHPTFVNHPISKMTPNYWVTFYEANNRKANGKVSDWMKSLRTKEEKLALDIAIAAEEALAEKEGRDADLEQFGVSNGANKRTKTIGQRFCSHLDKALQNLITWKQQDNAPDTMEFEQSIQTIKALKSRATKAEKVSH
tara:strand:- start:240 stop:986 length:747 start_codon:yes stop_codon:yes gene_type:complete